MGALNINKQKDVEDLNMIILDFKEIPPQNKGGANQDKFELFAEAFFKMLPNFEVKIGAGRGSDKGRDLIVEEKIANGAVLRWRVSCKHYAHSNKSVSAEAETDIKGKCDHHNTNGLIAFYSTIPSSSLQETFSKIQSPYNVSVYNQETIEALLLENKAYGIVLRYFPKSGKILSKIMDKLNQKDDNSDSLVLEKPKLNDFGIKKKYEYDIEVLTAADGYIDTKLFPSDKYFYIKAKYKAEYLNDIHVNTGTGFYSKISFLTVSDNLDFELQLKKRTTIFCEDFTGISQEVKQRLIDNKVALESFCIQIKINDLIQQNIAINTNEKGIHLLIDQLELQKIAMIKTFEISYIIPRLIESNTYPVVITVPSKEVIVNVKYNPLAFECLPYTMGGIPNIKIPNYYDAKLYVDKKSNIEHISRYHCIYNNIDIPISERKEPNGIPKIEFRVRSKKAYLCTVSSGAG